MSPSDALKGMGRSERKGGEKIGGEEMRREGSGIWKEEGRGKNRIE